MEHNLSIGRTVPHGVTTPLPGPQVRARWQSDWDGAAERIPDEWLVRDEDGWVGIEPGHCTCEASGKERYHCAVCLYASLARIGYAMGWLP